MEKQPKINVDEMMTSFEELCRSKGLKVTHQRLEIFRAMAEHSDHPTTENIYNLVRKQLKTISLDTVYRTIATFEEYGLIKRVHHIDNATRFDINVNNHHHLVCTRCHKIKDFSWPDFDQMNLPENVTRWGQIEVKHAVINGLCSECSAKKN